MTRSPAREGGTKTVVFGAVAAAVLAILIVGSTCCCFAFVWKRTDPVRGAARNYLKALATGDGELACTLMTRSFRQEMTSRWSAESCPDAIAVLLADLTAGQREDLGDTGISSVTATGGTGSVDLAGNPLGIVVLRLAKIDDEWLVAGDS